MTARDFFNFHKALFTSWEHGDIAETWYDNNHILCIRYTDGMWWHYSIENDNVIFW